MARIVDIQHSLDRSDADIDQSDASRHLSMWRDELLRIEHEGDGVAQPVCRVQGNGDVDATMAIDIIFALNFHAHELSELLRRCPAHARRLAQERLASVDSEIVVWRALLHATEFRGS